MGVLEYILEYNILEYTSVPRDNHPDCCGDDTDSHRGFSRVDLSVGVYNAGSSAPDGELITLPVDDAGCLIQRLAEDIHCSHGQPVERGGRQADEIQFTVVDHGSGGNPCVVTILGRIGHRDHHGTGACLVAAIDKVIGAG